MSTHGATRRAAFDAACALAAAGERPSVQAIRAKLGGRGGQQAILAGLNDWLAEVARRFALPALPDELQAAVLAFWEVACAQADGRFATARAEWDSQRAAIEQTLADTSAALETARGELGQTTAALADTQAALFALQQRASAAETAIAELTVRLADAETQIDTSGQLAARETEARQNAERVLVETREALNRAHGERGALATRLAAAVAERDALQQRLEQSVAERAALATEATSLRTATETANARLVERDRQFDALHAALERAQQMHDAESARALVRIDEQRQALTAARERERRDERERAALVREIQELSATLRARLAAETAQQQPSPKDPKDPDERAASVETDSALSMGIVSLPISTR